MNLIIGQFWAHHTLFFLILQQKRELLKSLDFLKGRLEKAGETCAVKEKELFCLEQQMNGTMQEVVF